MDFDIEKFFSEEGNEAASFDDKRTRYLEASKHYWEYYRTAIEADHAVGASGEVTVQALTAMTDLLLKKLFRVIIRDLSEQDRGKEMITLVAIGGFGRGELNPFSDIDLMFLHNGKENQHVENIAQKLLYFLWDLKLDVGYSVRTPNDCIVMSNADSTVKTALLDARFLIGSRILFRDFTNLMLTQVFPKGSDGFIKVKVQELEKRRNKYGSSVYILEPNIKEGEGALRDLHTAMWVAKIKYKVYEPRELILKGVLSDEELASYNDALGYLWRIRNEMHFRAARKNDQLTFEAQTRIASFLGYTDVGKVLAVEEFMRDYYLHATKVEHFSSLLISRCTQRDESAFNILGYFIRRPVGEGFYVMRGELLIPNEATVDEDPSRLMKLFEYAQKHGVTLNIKVKGLVRRSLDLVNDKFRRNKEVNRSFFNILRMEKGVGETLRLMHHLQFLNHFIPEFERIFCKVQHDQYHIYTVDTHSLFAVEEIAKLRRGEYEKDLPLLTNLAREVDKHEILLLAVLLHDIGKGAGGGHADRGADMMPTLARRMGMTKEEGECLEFLVRSHLLFAHIAQRRDLHDEKMIIQFARQMGKSENLKMLYLLTFADIKAVGPDVWTEWKALLLQELYEKTFQVLERGDFKFEAHGERVKKVKRKVIDLLGNEQQEHLAKEELRAMSTRHLLSNPPIVIADHINILLSLGEQTFVSRISHEMESGYSNFTICTVDVPGLFSMVTGVMAANGMNILGAQIHTSTNGKALDILQINSPQGFVITEESRWKKVGDDLRQVLEGKVKVKTLVEKRHRPTLLEQKIKPRFPSRVEIDNDVSEDYTVIDIYTHDKVGLLYMIASTLTELGLYIGVAKISTKVDQVADVFYVKDIFGHKVVKEDKLLEIRNRLVQAID